MNKFGRCLLGLWMVLAVIAFVMAFYTLPLFAKIIGLVFGGLNILIILSLAISAIQGLVAAKKLKKEK